jgi:hypothetical protein
MSDHTLEGCLRNEERLAEKCDQLEEERDRLAAERAALVAAASDALDAMQRVYDKNVSVRDHVGRPWFRQRIDALRDALPKEDSSPKT